MARKRHYLLSFVPVKWSNPLRDWMKLNTDESSVRNLGKTGVDAIIRDHEGNWVVESFRHSPCATSAEVELWATRDGLHLTVVISFISNVHNSNTYFN